MTMLEWVMSTPPCPHCECVSTVKNGHIHTGKQRYLCKTCHRQFVLNPTRAPIPQATQDQVEKLLVERVSLRGICRVLGVSRSWLQRYVNTRAAGVPQKVEVTAPKKTRSSRSSSSATNSQRS